LEGDKGDNERGWESREPERESDRVLVEADAEAEEECPWSAGCGELGELSLLVLVRTQQRVKAEGE
jgi:hypothetical protein